MKNFSFLRTDAIRPTFTYTTLTIAGFIVVYIGLEILFKPIAFYAAYQIELPESISLMNELRANGSYLIASGVIILAGVIMPSMLFTSVLIGAVLFSCFALTRMTSMAFDGIPSVNLIYAMGLEFIFAALLLSALIFQKKRP